MNVRKKSETATVVELEWDAVPGQQGYVTTLDGDEKMADGKRHFSGSKTARTVKIGKPDQNPHDYGVRILTVGDSGSVRVPADPSPPAGRRLWGDDSPLNTPIGPNPQVLVDYGQGALARLPTGSVGFNTKAYSVGYFEAGPSDPRYTVPLTDRPGMKLTGVPITQKVWDYIDFCRSQGDGECHLIIEDGEKVWNPYALKKAGTGATCSAAACLDVDGPGVWDNTDVWAVRASGLSSGAGLVLAREMQAGKIEHGLNVSLPKWLINKSGPVSPAKTSDGVAGQDGYPAGVPMGASIQLRPTLSATDLLGLGIPAAWLPMCKALQTYRNIVSDSNGSMKDGRWQGGNLVYYGESGQASGYAWPAFPHSTWGRLIQHMRIVAPPPMPDLDDSSTFGQPHS